MSSTINFLLLAFLLLATMALLVAFDKVATSLVINVAMVCLWLLVCAFQAIGWLSDVLEDLLTCLLTTRPVNFALTAHIGLLDKFFPAAEYLIVALRGVLSGLWFHLVQHVLAPMGVTEWGLGVCVVGISVFVLGKLIMDELVTLILMHCRGVVRQQMSKTTNAVNKHRRQLENAIDDKIAQATNEHVGVLEALIRAKHEKDFKEYRQQLEASVEAKFAKTVQECRVELERWILARVSTQIKKHRRQLEKTFDTQVDKAVLEQFQKPEESLRSSYTEHPTATTSTSTSTSTSSTSSFGSVSRAESANGAVDTEKNSDIQEINKGAQSPELPRTRAFDFDFGASTTAFGEANTASRLPLRPGAPRHLEDLEIFSNIPEEFGARSKDETSNGPKTPMSRPGYKPNGKKKGKKGGK
ncbi:hypothetical protein BDY21DRAFT_367495 [Lineolata rhizophorae]|uniref:Uncharacterized protein n=1 Tax=Lineolata rhizophorae TaxID=578093 RepID=A0A6A6NMX6_9PEZI|nr:hypothetical protein BDY21DRAFT_367495 [Lineolata rhizophorae]